MQGLKENNSKQKAQRRSGSEGWITPGPSTSTRTGAPLPAQGLAGAGAEAEPLCHKKRVCLSPVPLLKSGTNLQPKYFLWDGTIRTCRLVHDASSVPNGSGAPPCCPALPSSHGSSPSMVFEHPNGRLDCIARLQHRPLVEIWP